MLKKKKLIITGLLVIFSISTYFVTYAYAKNYYTKKFSNNFNKITSTISIIDNSSSSPTASTTSSNTAVSNKKTTPSSSSGSNGGGSDSGSGSGSSNSSSDESTSYWKPSVGDSYQIQFTGSLDTSVNAHIFDIDMFDTSSSTVSNLHSQGKKAVCYVDVGSWENWRDDADQFPSSVLGNVYSGYPDEKWLDIRQIDKLSPIISARFDQCKNKGFDGVDPDNINGYQNNTGFALSAQDQLTYNKWLSDTAHAKGLSTGLKNDTDQMNDLLSSFDWLVIESCYDQDWCNDAKPFVSAGKPVFQIEYTEEETTTSQFCSQSINNNFYGILKNQSLDGWRQTCQ